jgi:stage II sporulation protein E
MSGGTQAAEFAEKRKRLNLLARWMAKGKLQLESWVQAAWKPALMAAITFFLSFSQCFHVPSPFAVAWIIALGACGYPLWWPAIGCAAALGMRLIWNIPLDIWQYAGCGALLLTGRWWKDRRELMLSFMAVLALMPRFLSLLGNGVPGELLLGGAGIFMGAVAASAFRQSIRVLVSNRHTLSLDDKLCCLLLFMVLLTGMGYLELFGVNLGQGMAVAVVLCLSFVAGSAAAVCTGLLAGAALAFGGQDAMVMAQLSLAGMLAGLVIGRGKRWEVCVLFVLADLLAVFLVQSEPPALETGALITGCLVFLFTGEALLFRVKALLVAAQPVRSGMENEFASEQMRRWESAMDRMAQALPVTGMQEEMPEAEQLAAIFCKNCAETKSCWNEQFIQTKAILQAVLTQAEMGEDALDKAIMGLRGCGCIRLHGLKEATEQVLKEKRHQKAQEARARYERDMIRTHLTAMAQAVSRMAEAVTGETVGDAKAAFDISRVIREISFPGKLIYARQVGGHLQVGIEGDGLSLMRLQPEKLIRALKEKEKIVMQEVSCDRGKLLLEEVPPFDLRVGSATVSVSEPQGGDQPVSGDATIQEVFPGGLCLFGLSDGMGHGEHARRESQKTLELLALCMAAGYTKEQAITAVNGMMLSATGGDRFATVDICLMDLWTGDAQMEKLGACTSYLLRGEHVKAIAGAALPLGILEQVMPIHQRMKLHDGDILVLLSDGIQDAYPDGTSLEKAIARNAYKDPQRMADTLLRSALLSAGGVPKDDMTVLVVTVLCSKAAEEDGDAVQSMADAV